MMIGKCGKVWGRNMGIQSGMWQMNIGSPAGKKYSFGSRILPRNATGVNISCISKSCHFLAHRSAANAVFFIHAVLQAAKDSAMLRTVLQADSQYTLSFGPPELYGHNTKTGRSMSCTDCFEALDDDLFKSTKVASTGGDDRISVVRAVCAALAQKIYFYRYATEMADWVPKGKEYMLANWDSERLGSVHKSSVPNPTWCDVDVECKRRRRQPSKYGGDREDTPEGVGGRETQGQGQGSHVHRSPRG